MKKIAIVFDGDIFNLKGKVNSIINRIHYLQSIADYQIDVFSLQIYDSRTVCLYKKKKYLQHSNEMIMLDGISVNVIWLENYFIDVLLTSKMKKRPIFRDWLLWKIVDLFSDYSLISAHSFICGNLAYLIHKKFGLPYFCTWHGSEIHTIPQNNVFQRVKTAEILKNAECNFFVSKALEATARNEITSEFSSKILYNGVNGHFRITNEFEKKKLKSKYGVDDAKVVTYAGNLIDIKNPYLLAPIFAAIAQKYKGDLRFWIIGDGSMRDSVKSDLLKYNVECTMWGNQPADIMPEFFQCTDVCLLVSKNEGMCMVLLESIACGANAVGAKVGGIPEVLPSDCVFEHGPEFVNNISDKIVSLLQQKQNQELNEVFKWGHTAEIENGFYKKVLNV